MLSHNQCDKKSKVLVFGAGNFGSCLADHLGDSSHTVYMWSRSEKLVSHFNQYHRNPEALQELLNLVRRMSSTYMRVEGFANLLMREACSQDMRGARVWRGRLDV